MRAQTVGHVGVLPPEDLDFRGFVLMPVLLHCPALAADMPGVTAT